MSLLSPDVRFPYCNIHTVYLKCGNSTRLKQAFYNLIPLLYAEAIDVVTPVTGDRIVNAHYTFGVQVMQARAFYENFATDECYPWHVNEIAIQVPYGNMDEWSERSTNWLSKTARTLKNIWHAARLIPNRIATQRAYINLGIPFIPATEVKVDDLTDQELYDYCEIVLSSVSTQVWVMDRKVFTPHVHSC